jgi:hypothetical protein
VLVVLISPPIDDVLKWMFHCSTRMEPARSTVRDVPGTS